MKAETVLFVGLLVSWIVTRFYCYCTTVMWTILFECETMVNLVIPGTDPT